MTAGGKNVAPQNIESLLKQSPWVNHAAVFGDRKPYVVALITLNPDAMARFARETGRDADLAKLASDPEVRARIQLEVDAVNRKLSQFETVKRFAILPADFTTDSGEADADAQDTAQGRGRALRRRHRGAVRLTLRRGTRRRCAAARTPRASRGRGTAV